MTEHKCWGCVKKQKEIDRLMRQYSDEQRRYSRAHQESRGYKFRVEELEKVLLRIAVSGRLLEVK